MSRLRARRPRRSRPRRRRLRAQPRPLTRGQQSEPLFGHQPVVAAHQFHARPGDRRRRPFRRRTAAGCTPGSTRSTRYGDRVAIDEPRQGTSGARGCRAIAGATGCCSATARRSLTAPSAGRCASSSPARPPPCPAAPTGEDDSIKGRRVELDNFGCATNAICRDGRQSGGPVVAARRERPAGDERAAPSRPIATHSRPAASGFRAEHEQEG